MIYAIADIHGCRRELEQLLEIIHFSENDTLYLLGDYVDRGPDPVGVLELISGYSNMIPLAGNHEMMLLRVLPTALKTVDDENLASFGADSFLEPYLNWMQNGGSVTAEQFRRLDREDQEFYLEFAEDMSVYEEITVNGRHYFLIHSLPKTFRPDETDLFEYPVHEILFGRPDFSAEWNQRTIYLTGHTPTRVIPGAEPGKIWRRGNLIDIDCGCVSGGNLCAYCLNTEEAFYVPKS